MIPAATRETALIAVRLVSCLTLLSCEACLRTL